MSNRDHIADLVHKVLAGEADAAELQELKQLMQHQEADEYVQAVESEVNQHGLNDTSLPAYDEASWDPLISDLLAQDKIDPKPGATVHKVRFLRTGWGRYAAAVMLVAGIAVYWFLRGPHRDELVHTPDVQKQNDIAPGGNKAILTLANGSSIVLDSASNGNLASQGNTKIIKLDDGSLAYNAADKNGTLMYNTISTPRGGQYKVVLSDGSRVWLNAASSIRFPSVFSGNTRRVEVTGEVYAEVAPDDQKPFIMSARGTEVNVLGTSFNMNAYDDEASVKTTLLEGGVRVTAYNRSQLLLPSQQCETKASGQLVLNEHIDAEDVIAWKNGIFRFNNASIPSVMRQVARWYDVEIVYNDHAASNEVIVGEIQRKLTLKQMVKVLGELGVACRMEGRKLVVL